MDEIERKIERMFDNMPMLPPSQDCDSSDCDRAGYPHDHSDGATHLCPGHRNDPQPGPFEPGHRWPVSGAPGDIVASELARRRYWVCQGLTPDQAADAALFELHGRGPRAQPALDPATAARFARLISEAESCRRQAGLDCLVRFPIEVRARGSAVARS